MAKKWFEISGVSLLMLGLAILSTYPLIQYFDFGMPYGPVEGELFLNRTGDQFQLLYWFWLVKENFLGTIPFDSNPFEFNMLVPHETSGLNTIPLAFLYMLFSPLGDVAAYNCLIFSSYVLAGVFMYLLAYQYSGSRIGAILAAIIFTFAPSRVKGFVGGHGYGFLYFCYPFILYFLEKGIRSQKIRYGFISGICFVGLGMLEPHLTYYICVFLGLYIPIRMLSSFTDHFGIVEGQQTISGKVFSWSRQRSLFIIWLTGIVAVLYTQYFFTYQDDDPFISPSFWWVISLYPLIFVLVSLCCAAVYRRLTPLSFSESLGGEAGSLLPLLALFIVCMIHPVPPAWLVVSGVSVLFAAKLFLFRHHLFTMLKVAGTGIWQERKSVFPILPLIASMGAIVYWIAGSKAGNIENTIAGGGRTLADVKLFSSHLSDIFISTSIIYLGIVPALLGGGLLLRKFYLVTVSKKGENFDGQDNLLILFYLATAFCSYILAMGLAFGKSSLYILFFDFFPFFNYPRVSDRIVILTLFSLAVLSAYVVAMIQKRFHGRFSVMLISCVFLVMTGFQLKDYNVLKPMAIIIVDRGQSIYNYVKENIGDGLLLEVPIWPGDSHQSSLYQHYIMFDRVPRINGYSPMVLSEYIETVFKPLSPINQGRLEREQYEFLRKLNVKFITFHDNRDVFLPKVSPFAPLTTVRRLKNSPYLELVDIKNKMFFKNTKETNNDLYLFRVKDPSEVLDTGLPVWYEMPYFYDSDIRLHKQIGEIAIDESIGRKVFQATEGNDKDGFLVYGPYDIYSPGDYRCYYTINTDAETDDIVARLEVTSFNTSGEQIVLAQKKLKGNEKNGRYRKEYLDFSIAEYKKLEFRVYYYGKGLVRVEKITVNKIGNDSPLQFIKAEMMVGDTGQLKLEKDAVTGKVIEALVQTSKGGDMVYGPNRIYPKGKYTARFRMRMKAGKNVKENATVAIASVSDGQNVKVFSKRNVRAGNLSNAFSETDVDFVLDREQELSFHVFFTGKASLQLDVIKVERRDV